MHQFDRDGAIHEYRVRRARHESYRAMLFAVGCVCGLVLIVCAGLITLSMIGK